MDGVGLDTVAFIEDNYIQERGLPTSTVEWLRKNYIDQGKLGAKSGKGGLYPAGHTVNKGSGSHHDNLTAPTLYVLDVGLGENVTENFASSGKIYAASANGENVRKLADNLPFPDGIDISMSEGRMFWTNMGIPSQNDGTIESANLDGSGRKMIVPAGVVHTPKQLTIDHVNKKVYFCDREGMRVHRINFDGSGHEILVQNGDFNNSAEKSDQTKHVSLSPIASSKRVSPLTCTSVLESQSTLSTANSTGPKKAPAKQAKEESSVPILISPLEQLLQHGPIPNCSLRTCPNQST